MIVSFVCLTITLLGVTDGTAYRTIVMVTLEPFETLYSACDSSRTGPSEKKKCHKININFAESFWTIAG